MNSILIRNLSDQTKRALRIRAAENGRSMEEEAKTALNRHLGLGGAVLLDKHRPGLGTAIHDMFKSVGGADDLPVLTRDKQRAPPDFSD